MYNGIGLKTARGTGTNGYIQRNQSNLRPRDTPFDKQPTQHAQVRHTQPDAGILEHERKRKIELQCMELQVELEDQDVADDVIEARVSELRTRLLQSNTPTQQQQRGKIGPGETHKLREAKNVEDTRLSRALNVDTTYKEGDAFNRDLQQQRKQERIDNRQRADDQRRLDYQRKQNLDTHHRTRSRSPVRRQPSRRRSPSRSPPPQRRLRSPSRSPQRWHRSPSRSLSPQRRRSYSRSSTPQRRRSSTRSPSPQRTDSRSTSPIAIRKSVSPQPAIIRAPPGPPPVRPPGL